MKFKYFKWTYFPKQNSQINRDELIANQKGQSLVEFVLLLSVIMLISLLFLKLINTNIANYWQAMGTVLLEDPTQRIEMR